jgi:chorismate mutase
VGKDNLEGVDNSKQTREKPVAKGIFIAGPCSAETESQVLQTAHALKPTGIDLFRSGIWKPRTRPNSFEGIGTEGLSWLQKVQSETGLKVCTEVANSQHVEACLKHGIDALWIGARTTVSPFAVQEIADALRGSDIPVMVKNPINTDLKLWIGAIERIQEAGIKDVQMIHRGFSVYGGEKYRNQPRWQIAIEMMRAFPDLKMICDSSHISGKRDLIAEVSQKALDLNYDGIMLEVHPTPDEAWSDAAQQITPDTFAKLKANLKFRDEKIQDTAFLGSLEVLRNQIDDIDDELIALVARRMNIADLIGGYKKANNVSILQKERWAYIVEKTTQKGEEMGLSLAFISDLLKAIHQESIERQYRVMSRKGE